MNKLFALMLIQQWMCLFVYVRVHMRAAFSAFIRAQGRLALPTNMS